jgi:hypothetical protein
MNTYKTNTPAAPIAIAAILMTAATLALCVGGPIAMDKSAPVLPQTTAQVRQDAQAPATEVDIVPGRIEVVAVREPTVHATLMRMLHPKRKQQV